MSAPKQKARLRRPQNPFFPISPSLPALRGERGQGVRGEYLGGRRQNRLSSYLAEEIGDTVWDKVMAWSDFASLLTDYSSARIIAVP